MATSSSSEHAQSFRSADGVYTSPFAPLPKLEPGTIFDYACGRLHRLYGQPGHDERAMLKDYSTGRTWTVKQVRDQCTRIAATLISVYKLKPGDHLLLCFPTSAAFAMLCYACARAGLVVALANPAYTPKEMQHTTTLANAKLILTVDAFMPVLRKAGLDERILIDAQEGAAGKAGGKSSQSLFANLVSSTEEAERILQEAGANNVDWTTPCGIFFSSGTTGLPKAVLISHRNMIFQVATVNNLPGSFTPPTWNKGEPSSHIVFLPAFHVAGYGSIMVASFEGGCINFAMSNPIDLKLIVAAIREIRPWRMIVVPPLLLALTKLGLCGPGGLENVVGRLYSGAAPLGASLHKEAEQKLKVSIGQYWGMSETSGAATGSDLTEVQKGGCAGKVLAGMELKLVDENGAAVPHRERGEIWVRGPVNMVGYYKNEKETAATIDKDGWLHTGDVGYVDDDGDLFIVDRIKELIKYKGFQVAPAELEAILLSHPSILDVGVTGFEDIENPGNGEAPRAFIVLAPDALKSGGGSVKVYDGANESIKVDRSNVAREIADFLAERVSHYKQLRGGVVFLREIPKNPSGKILRRMLRDWSKNDSKPKL